MQKERTLLVTGATGFIGQHVMRELAARNIASYALVRAVPETPFPGDVAPMMQDMADAHDLPPVTHCLHLAWGGLPNYKNPTHLEDELPKQKEFLARVLKNDVRKLVVTGSCLEYGMQEGELAETNELRPTVPYTHAKRELLRWLEQQPLDLCWARLFYTYGEGQRPCSLLPLLAAAVARGEKRFPMSGGQQQRDFMEAAQAATHLVDLLQLPGNHGAVNICSGAPMTVEQRVRQWIEDHRWEIDLELGRYPYPDYEPMAFWGDRSKLDRLMAGEQV